MLVLTQSNVIISRTNRTSSHVFVVSDTLRLLVNLSWGLSPCVWGHRYYTQGRFQYRGSIPMCMGPPTPSKQTRLQGRVYPHVYGATGLEYSTLAEAKGLSPCVWGHRNRQVGRG